jgi:hypothetical protein
VIASDVKVESEFRLVNKFEKEVLGTTNRLLSFNKQKLVLLRQEAAVARSA